MKIIHFLDMQSTKYGGLGRFFVRLMKEMKDDEFWFVFHTIPSSKALINDFEALGAHIVVMNTGSGKNAIKAIPQFVKLIRSVKPDVVHFHFANSFFIYAPIAKILGVKRLMKTQHCCITTDDNIQINNKSELTLRTKIASLNGVVYRLFDTVVMCGEYVYSQFATLYPRTWGGQPHYKTIYFGVEKVESLPENEALILKEELDISSEKIVLCSIAFAHEIKGMDILIDALAKVKSDNYVLVIVGFNDKLPLTQELYKRAQELGVDEKIRWVGITDNVGQYLSVSDIYIQPSRSEALTLAVCEAKSAGLPVIGSKVGGLLEISDLTFEMGNTTALAEQIDKLIEDKDLRERLGKESYDSYINNFDINVGAKQYKELY